MTKSNDALQDEIDALSENLNRRFTELATSVDNKFNQNDEQMSIAFGGVNSDLMKVYRRLEKIEEALKSSDK